MFVAVCMVLGMVMAFPLSGGAAEPPPGPYASLAAWFADGGDSVLTQDGSNYTLSVSHMLEYHVTIDSGEKLIVSGPNVFTIGSYLTVASGGSLSVDNSDNLGTGTLTLDSGTLSVGSGANITQNISLSGSGGTVDVPIGDAALSGSITGTNLIKTGAGKLILTGINAGVTVNAGTFEINGNVSGVVTVSNGTATINGNITNNLIVSGGSVTITGTVSGTVSHTGGTINTYAVSGTPCACAFCNRVPQSPSARRG